ncbi:transmembrane protein 59-like [Lineus longissimus]|uniref:transmembrane protein 59-like n=1 Tax=Lineus longissimus TaxID=88925 RepID=UPI002B4E096B
MEKMEQICWVLLIFCICSAAPQDIFDRVLGDDQPCNEVCENTYPQHTYEKPMHYSYCLRGCRLFSIIEFVEGAGDVNSTKDACLNSCQEAYPKADDQQACNSGCISQVPFAVKKHKMMEDATQNIHLLFPMMYMQSMCNRFMDNVAAHVSYTSAYFMQADNGQIVIVRSQPKVYTEIITGGNNEYRTKNYLETNLMGVDNSATPNLKSAQIRPNDAREINYATSEDQGQNSDWLDCVSRKTGLPRLLLSMTIFLSAFFMIWLCFTTAATAPDHRVQSQKLSIYGDLDYLKEIKDKALLAGFHPQDKTGITEQAPALPIKINVEKI